MTSYLDRVLVLSYLEIGGENVIHKFGSLT